MALHDVEPDPNANASTAAPDEGPRETGTPNASRPRKVGAIEARVANLARDVRLSLRERTVLRLIAQGYRYREIGCEMSISPRTVKMYAANLRRKVGGDSRWDLMRRVLAD